MKWTAAPQGWLHDTRGSVIPETGVGLPLRIPGSAPKQIANHHHTIMAKGNNAHKKEVKKPKKVKPKP